MQTLVECALTFGMHAGIFFEKQHENFKYSVQKNCKTFKCLTEISKKRKKQANKSLSNLKSPEKRGKVIQTLSLYFKTFCTLPNFQFREKFI